MTPYPREAFDMAQGHDMPLSDFAYDPEPKLPGTTVVPLCKKRYASMKEATERMKANLEHRGLVIYHRFATARHFVLYTKAK